MKKETLDLYAKYRYVLHLLSDERNELFQNDPDFEKFFEAYNMTICFHWKIKNPYKNFNRRRNELIKRFEYGKYNILLQEKFCYDISLIILSYIIKV